MSAYTNLVVISTLLFGLVLGCNSAREESNQSNQASKPGNSTIVKTVEQPASDGTIPSGTGVEKEAPAADKANVQGKA